MEKTDRTILLDALGEVCFKLPFAAMREVGPATQTFAGLLRITNTETFVPAEEIARQSCLPVKTVRNHLEKLDAKGWIKDKGRQRMSKGRRRRRTVTYAITAKIEKNQEPYGLLPWWASYRVPGTGKMPWSSKAVLSVIVAELAKLKSVVIEMEGGMPDSDEFAGAVANLGGQDRFRFSLDRLESLTGLDHKSIRAAKETLSRGLVVWMRDREGADMLVPRCVIDESDY